VRSGRFRASPALRQVTVLVTGTVVAQIVPLLASPVLARVFAPEAFGQLATYLAFVSIMSVVATGRYELAIVPARDDRSAAVLLRLALLLALTFSLVAEAAFALTGQFLGRTGGLALLGNMVYLMPLSVFLVSVERSFSSWLARKTAFRWIAINRILQASSTSVSQIAAGLLGIAGSALIYAQLIGHFVGLVGACSASRFNGWAARGALQKEQLKAEAFRHISYPRFMVPGSLANETASQLPILILAGYYGGESVGYFAMAQRILTAPVSLVTSAIGEVFRVEAASRFREFGDCLKLYRRNFAIMATAGIVLVVPFALAGPWIFAIVFGERWRPSGQIAVTLSIMMYFQLIALPFGQTLLLAGMQKADFLWNISRLIVVAAVLIGGGVYEWSFHAAILAYSIVFSGFFAIHIVLQNMAASGLAGTQSRTGPALNVKSHK
jgi:O-antigen/teichoic acid export membrane protein